MRPNSIVWFERLFLGSLLLGVINAFLVYDNVVAVMDADPNMAALGMGGGFAIVIWVVSFAISLLLWYLIARKASTVAKWIFVVLTVVGLLMTSLNPGEMLTFANILTGLIFVMQLASVVVLFFPDATAWFKAARSPEPEKPEGGVTLK